MSATATSSVRQIVLSVVLAILLLPISALGQGAEETTVRETASSETDAVPEEPQSAYPSVDRQELIHRLESDRLLLAQVRKQVPQTREEAELYLARLKRLAIQSDPVRLVPLANRVLDQSVIYYDWLEQEFDDPGERVAEYYVGGARGFHIALEEFRSAAMFTVINRLDVTVGILAEMTDESSPKAQTASE